MFSVVLATLQVLHSHRWLAATLLDNVDLEHFHHCTKFYWVVLEHIKCYVHSVRSGCYSWFPVSVWEPWAMEP